MPALHRAATHAEQPIAGKRTEAMRLVEHRLRALPIPAAGFERESAMSHGPPTPADIATPTMVLVVASKR